MATRPGNTCDQAPPLPAVSSSDAKCKFYLWIWFLATNNSAQHSPYNKIQKFWFDKLIQMAEPISTHRPPSTVHRPSSIVRLLAPGVAAAVNPCTGKRPCGSGPLECVPKIYHLPSMADFCACWNNKICCCVLCVHGCVCVRVRVLDSIVLMWLWDCPDRIVQEIKNWGNEIWLLVSAARWQRQGASLPARCGTNTHWQLCSAARCLLPAGWCLSSSFHSSRATHNNYKSTQALE